MQGLELRARMDYIIIYSGDGTNWTKRSMILKRCYAICILFAHGAIPDTTLVTCTAVPYTPEHRNLQYRLSWREKGGKCSSARSHQVCDIWQDVASLDNVLITISNFQQDDHDLVRSGHPMSISQQLARSGKQTTKMTMP